MGRGSGGRGVRGERGRGGRWRSVGGGWCIERGGDEEFVAWRRKVGDRQKTIVRFLLAKKSLFKVRKRP